MKTHILTETDIDNIRNSDSRSCIIHSSTGNGSKGIYTVFRSPTHGWYEVESMGRTVLQTASLGIAVERYNSL